MGQLQSLLQKNKQLNACNTDKNACIAEKSTLQQDLTACQEGTWAQCSELWGSQLRRASAGVWPRPTCCRGVDRAPLVSSPKAAHPRHWLTTSLPPLCPSTPPLPVPVHPQVDSPSARTAAWIWRRCTPTATRSATTATPTWPPRSRSGRPACASMCGTAEQPRLLAWVPCEVAWPESPLPLLLTAANGPHGWVFMRHGAPPTHF